MASEGLDVIALISGGKDSFYSLLHCIDHGHRIVALANLFPGDAGASPELQVIRPTTAPKVQAKGNTSDEKDLNSFMYQTVGHEIIPLYAAATGLPLYRQPIRGGAVRHERDYDFSSIGEGTDETESMRSLLEAIMKRHPKANALSAGAILSTYQRTRVESVALRLGLTPLAYLWKYPVLPSPTTTTDDTQLLKDMAAVSLNAHIIKVASAGLDEHNLWELVTSVDGADRVKKALRKFGAAGGAVLGEGGEFETIVLDGPARLFKKKIKVSKEASKVVCEGGGSSWLLLRGAELEEKSDAGPVQAVRVPDLLDYKFKNILTETLSPPEFQTEPPSLSNTPKHSTLLNRKPEDELWSSRGGDGLLHWVLYANDEEAADTKSIESETIHLLDRTRTLLSKNSLDASDISNTMIILRHMSDFPQVNAVYGKLFTKPNPPSRVTVSCGELLPHGSNIMIFLTANTASASETDRQGLHVQSRSLWAPANIGPYSQAVGIPIAMKLDSQDENLAVSQVGIRITAKSKVRAWSIAGQIPLIPSTMALPAPSNTSHEMQIVLSLQHLWRIAVDLDVQFWTSAVAFFSRPIADSNKDMEYNAKLAGRAWRLAHGAPDEDKEEDNGLDPWDLKYNPQYMSLGGDQGKKGGASLPDWSVLILRHQNEPETCLPPFFAVEVEELPRGSAVEWQAHIGLSGLEDSSVEIIHHGRDEVESFGWRAWHTIARSEDGPFLHTVLALDYNPLMNYRDIRREMANVHMLSLGRLNVHADAYATHKSPYLTYIDGTNTTNWSTEYILEGEGDGLSSTLPYPIISCRSIWSPTGKRLQFISLYRTTLQ